MMDSYPYLTNELDSLVDDLGSNDSLFQSPAPEPNFAPSWVMEPKLEYFPEFTSPKQIQLTPEQLESLFSPENPTLGPILNPFDFEIEADINTYELPFDEYGDHKLAVLRELMTFTTQTPATDELMPPVEFTAPSTPSIPGWLSPAFSTKTLVGSCEPERIKIKEEPWDSPEFMDLTLPNGFDYASMQRSLRSLIAMDFSVNSDEDMSRSEDDGYLPGIYQFPSRRRTSVSSRMSRAASNKDRRSRMLPARRSFMTHKPFKRQYPDSEVICRVGGCCNRSWTPQECAKHRETHFPGRFRCPGLNCASPVFVRSSSLVRHLKRATGSSCARAAGPQNTWGRNAAKFETHSSLWKIPGFLDEL